MLFVMNQNTNRRIDSRNVSHGTHSHGRTPRYELGSVSSADVRRGRNRQIRRIGGTAAVASLLYLGYGTDFINISGPENDVQDHLDNVPGAQQVYDDWAANTVPENPDDMHVTVPEHPSQP